MRYLCVHCDKTFDHEATDKKPRCPDCMRVNGLEEVADPAASPRRAWPAWTPYAAAGAVLVAAGLGYAAWARNAAETVGETVPLRPLRAAEVTGHLRRRQVDAPRIGELLQPGEALSTLGEEAAGGASGLEAARNVQRALRDRAAEGAFAPWSLGIPRQAALKVDGDLAEALAEDGARNQLYPLEVAAAMAAALRSQGVTAMVAEAYAFPGARTPPDPSGQIGYYVVAVYEEDAAEGDPTYFDPYGGREVAPEEVDVLNDVEAIGSALGIEALRLLSRESEAERALDRSEAALRLRPRSATLRAVRGAVLLAGFRAEDGLRELQTAAQLRSDPPRLNLVATMLLAQQDIDGAARLLSRALEASPDFAAGRATLAMVHLARGDTAEAEAELRQAERLDPELDRLPAYWAAYYIQVGDPRSALGQAREAVRRQPADIDARLRLALVHRFLGDYDRMRLEAHRVMDAVPAGIRPQVRQRILAQLGSTALEPVDEELLDEPLDDADDLADAPPVPAGPTGGFQLRSRGLLGGGGGGPSLLDDADEPGPSLLGGDGLEGGTGLPVGAPGAPSGDLQLRLGGE